MCVAGTTLEPFAMDKAGDGRKRYVMAKPEAAYAALF